MKKIILILALAMFSVVAIGQEPLKTTTDQMKKEISRLKEDIKIEKKQKRAELNKHKENISYKQAQIKDREKIVKSIKNYKK